MSHQNQAAEVDPSELVRGAFSDDYRTYRVRASCADAPDSFQVLTGNGEDIVLIVSGLNSGDLKATWGRSGAPSSPSGRSGSKSPRSASSTVAANRSRPPPPRSASAIAKTMAASAAFGDDGLYNLHSEGEPGIHGHLGWFRRGPAVFSVYEIPPDRGRYPNGPTIYLIDVNDGADARECCRFTDDPEDAPEWNGAWNNDEWCPWILKRARALIAAPDKD
jgi:hypothetical protein